jgi:hypothetical protein
LTLKIEGATTKERILLLSPGRNSPANTWLKPSKSILNFEIHNFKIIKLYCFKSLFKIIHYSRRRKLIYRIKFILYYFTYPRNSLLVVIFLPGGQMTRSGGIFFGRNGRNGGKGDDHLQRIEARDGGTQCTVQPIQIRENFLLQNGSRTGTELF